MVTIYTTETCPKCKMLKAKLTAKGIDYKECTDMEIMASLGFRSVPYLEVNEQLMNFSEANDWINKQGE